jgi:hypothetical protein
LAGIGDGDFKNLNGAIENEIDRILNCKGGVRDPAGDSIGHDALKDRAIESLVPDANVINQAIEVEIESVILSGADVKSFRLNCSVGSILGWSGLWNVVSCRDETVNP